jgi:hypothetical protein
MSLLHERRLTLTKLAQREKVNPATTWRWGLKGVHGIKLETIIVGGRRQTSEEAWERFSAALNGEEVPAVKPSATNRKRQAAIAAAERELAAAGF